MSTEDVFFTRNILNFSVKVYFLRKRIVGAEIKGQRGVGFFECIARSPDTNLIDETNIDVAGPLIFKEANAQVKLMFRDVGDGITFRDIAKKVCICNVRIKLAIDIGVSVNVTGIL